MPMSDEEAEKGATNRVQNARTAVPEAEFWVGVEAGARETKDGMETIGICVVLSPAGIGKAHQGTFPLPPLLAHHVRSGVELAAADDLVFGRVESGRANGAVGILTGDAVTRFDLTLQAVTLALIPFKNAPLFSAPLPTK